MCKDKRNCNQTLYESKSSIVHCKIASLPTATVILGIGSTKDGRIWPCADENSAIEQIYVSVNYLWTLPISWKKEIYKRMVQEKWFL